MRSICLIFLLGCLLGFVVAGSGIRVRAQQAVNLRAGPSHQVQFTLTRGGDTSFTLPHQFILAGSDSVFLDSARLIPQNEYILETRIGFLTFSREMLSMYLVDTLPHILRVHYRSLPFGFKGKYQHREPVTRVDTASGEVIKVSKPPSKFSLDDLFGANLQKSGSLVRGFTIATNRDLSLNSGFRMQMSGNLTNDLELVAALTDENSPIQPEGTTQTLQEIDKVFIELRGEHVRATMGDFNLSLSGNEFGRLNRKLQGAQGLASYRAGDVQGEFLISGAVTRGKFATNQFEGLDGVQGPYRLAGQSNTRTIIVIAGTERVYVNGEKMVRGENSDYTIDYANAEVTFTPRRLISRGSRITVDFEYSDRRFTRSLLAAKSGTSFFNNQWLFNATVVRENDDENSPIDVAIADSDKVILQNAGDDASKASRSGVEVVGPGKGQYIRVDTTVVLATGGDSTITIYRYTPEDTLRAIYSVTFSLVGRGSYKKVSVGQYQFIGLYQGSYDPIRFLPLPQSHTLTDFDITGQVWENVKIMGEYALTNFDPNRFSVLDDDLHTGSAVKFSMQFSPKNIRIGGNNIGSLNLSMKERYVNSRFVALDRTNDVEFNRKWNVADSSSTDEEIREGLMTYQPIEQIAIDGGIGWIKRGELFSSKRYSLSGRLADKTIPQANYDVELIKSRNEGSGSSGHWTRQRATLQYRIGVVEPAVRYADELLANRNTISDTMITGSYRLREVVPGLSFGTAENRFANVEIGWRWDDSLAEGSLQRASRTFTHRYVAQLPEWKSFASSIDLTIQNRKFSDVFIRRRNTDGQTILLRWQTRFSPWNRGVESDWFYELATERSAKLEKIFQRVGKGTGNYVYAGDLNGNHIIDSPDFQLSRFDADFIALTVPTDELIPVIDLKASTRIRLAPALIFAPDGWVRKAVSTLSTETYLRVEEKSSEPDTRQIYLLHFSRFLNDQTTIAGSNLLTQDIYFQENRTDFFVRFRYSQRRALTQFALVNERTYLREQSLRLRWQLIPEIANQIDYSLRKDALAATQLSNRLRDVSSSVLSSDWSYRPDQKVELGFKVSAGTSTNFDTTVADLNDQSVRLIYSIGGSGQARVDLAREEVQLSRQGNSVPFELTNGKIAGRTWLWRIAFDYRLTQFIQATVGYDGRSEGDRAPVHTARAEVRAFF